MGTKMKGIFKGFKHFPQIFGVWSAAGRKRGKGPKVYKEREMEIGYPTDVRHVAHIGWDGTSAAPPNWMNEFKTGPEFSAPSMRSLTQSRDRSSIPIDVQQSLGLPTGDDVFQTEAPEVRRKIKRKKNKATSASTSSSSSSSSRATRRRSKLKAADNQRGGMESQIAVI